MFLRSINGRLQVWSRPHTSSIIFLSYTSLPLPVPRTTSLWGNNPKIQKVATKGTLSSYPGYIPFSCSFLATSLWQQHHIGKPGQLSSGGEQMSYASPTPPFLPPHHLTSSSSPSTSSSVPPTIVHSPLDVESKTFISESLMTSVFGIFYPNFIIEM